MVNHCDVKKGVRVTNLLLNAKEKKIFFRKQFSKFRALDNSDLQIKRSLQNETTDYNNYTYVKTILSTQIYLFVTVNKENSSYNVIKELSTGDREMYFRYVRMTPNCFEYLVTLVALRITKTTTNYRKPILSEQGLSLTLRHLASGEVHVSLSFQYRR